MAENQNPIPNNIPPTPAPTGDVFIPSAAPGRSSVVPPTPAPVAPVAKTEPPKKEGYVPPTAAPFKPKKQSEGPEIKLYEAKKDAPPPARPSGERSSSGGGKILKWFFILLLILVGIFYAVLLWGLLSGNVSNPLFETIGIAEEELQGTLLSVTNGLFGFLALIALLGTLVKFFQWLIIGRNAANRREYAVRASVFFGFFIVIAGIWIGLYWLITNVNAEARKLAPSIILTTPANVIGLTAPVEVTFDVGTELFKQIEKELIRQINWDFDGDGTYDASGETVTHRFLNKGAANGRFPVKVDVVYFSPSVQEEKTFSANREVIVANEAVQAVITASPETGKVPLVVTLSGEKSQDPDGNIVLYEWDLDNDGSYERSGPEEVSVENTFAKVGEYTVRLRVTGANTDTAMSEKTIIVQESEEDLVAKITSDKTFEALVPFDITLDGAQSFTRSGQIVRYEWLVQGEEKPVEGRKLQRTFRTPGQYEVTLTVENDLGERDQETQILHALAQPGEVNVMLKTTPPSDEKEGIRGTSPLEVTFDPSPSNVHNAVEWQWDFEDDGVVDNVSKVVKHVFRDPGVYTVRLAIVDTVGQKYETTQRVTVARAGVNAKISATPTSGEVPLTVNFDGSGSTTDRGEIADYIWEFPGREPVHSGAQIAYEFKTVGAFPVKLTVLTSQGETDDESMLISVRSHPLQAQFEIKASETDPLSFSFDPQKSTGTITEYLWDFGDGSASREFQPSHMYQAVGEYSVTLKVTDVKGVVSRMTQTVTIK